MYTFSYRNICKSVQDRNTLNFHIWNTSKTEILPKKTFETIFLYISDYLRCRLNEKFPQTFSAIKMTSFDTEPSHNIWRNIRIGRKPSSSPYIIRFYLWIKSIRRARATLTYARPGDPISGNPESRREIPRSLDGTCLRGKFENRRKALDRHASAFRLMVRVLVLWIDIKWRKCWKRFNLVTVGDQNGIIYVMDHCLVYFII